MHYVDAFVDLNVKGVGIPFPRLAGVKKGETVLFSWIVFNSRSHRDRVNARVMKDRSVAKMMENPDSMSMDSKRMTYGGFRLIVDL